MKEEAIAALQTAGRPARGAALAEQERPAALEAARAGGDREASSPDRPASLLPTVVLGDRVVAVPGRLSSPARLGPRARGGRARDLLASLPRRSPLAVPSAFDAALGSATPRAAAPRARALEREVPWARDCLRPALPSAAPLRGSRPSCSPHGAGSSSTEPGHRARVLGEDTGSSSAATSSPRATASPPGSTSPRSGAVVDVAGGALMQLAEPGARAADPRRGRARRRRQARRARARPDRPARRRARAARGHPGLAKTLAARSFAQVTRHRLQPDPVHARPDAGGRDRLLDLEPARRRFEFRPGPIFTNLLLADEINRAPPKTQAALLEAMQERQVTIEGITHPLARPFLVLATQNPIEYEGTYPLPEAQLDRFLLRVGFGYPSKSDEWQVLARRLERREDEVELDPVIDGATLLELQAAIEHVHVGESVGRYIVELVAATRAQQLDGRRREPARLARAAQARALQPRSRGRDFVTPDDVKAVAVPALAHRLMLRPELWVQRLSGDDVVREVLESVPTPAPKRRRRQRNDALGVAARAAYAGARGARPARRARRPAAGARGPRCAVRAAPSLGLRARAAAGGAGLADARTPSASRAKRSTWSRPRLGAAVERLELVLVLPDGLEVLGRGRAPAAAGLRRRAEVALPLRCARWGNYPLGDSGCGRATGSGSSPGGRSTGPRTCASTRARGAARMVAPVQTQPFAGNEVARQKGEGLEFADLGRSSGDRVRSINWRASARRNG